MMTILMLALFLMLLAIKMPVSISMGLSTLITIVAFKENLLILPQLILMAMDNYLLMAVPFFILAGVVMNECGITERIFGFSKEVVGHLPGGLAQVNVLASLIFAGVSGAAIADCAGLGTIQIKAMNDAGFRKPFSAAVTVTSACIGPIFPPSIGLIIYAIMSNTSIAKVLVAGVVPGVCTAVLIMIFIWYLVKSGKEKCPITKRSSLWEIAKSFKNNFFALIAPIVLLLCFVTGIATPTEAGVIAIFYAVFVGILYGDLKLGRIPTILEEALILSSLIMFIIATATVMGHIMTVEQIPLKLSDCLLTVTTNKYLLLIMIIIFLVLLGSFLEGMPALLITVPILVPLVQALNIDLIHFGIAMGFALILGIMTPPMAIGIYILVGITGCSFEEISKETIKFYIPMIIMLLLVTFIPEISLFLPNLLFR